MNSVARNSHRLLLAALALVVCGCGTIRVPAIDPTGQQILLPQPSYTTLESPFGRGPSCWPRPAFAEPPSIPPCPPAVTLPTVVPPTVPAPRPPVVVGGPLLQDRLLLSPTRIVAPINSEVVLLAGICGPDGYFVTRQPIEWSLSQESVGQFVDGGESGRHHLSRHTARRLHNDHAVTHTSKVARIITRGTPVTSDDVGLRRGQAWISLTSASQGISYVTAVATGAENWEQRRQLARVHWVDAQWELPPPAVVPSGGVHTLTTKITRSSGSRPVTDWTVRYTVAGGAGAIFGSTGLTTIEQPTDANGDATVTIAQQTPGPGSTNVRIEILSPAEGDAPVSVGEGGTTITWSSPGLGISVSGPEVAATGSTVVYGIEVRNSGDLTTGDVRVSAEIPATFRYLNSEPPARLLGNSAQWQIGPVSAGETRNLELRCRAGAEGRVELLVRAVAGQLSDQDAVATQVQGPALEIRLDDPPTSVPLGGRVTFNFQVTNAGIGRLSNVTLRDTFDEGLEYTEGEGSPIEKSLGDLEPGERRNIGVSFFARRVGNLCHTIEAFTEDGYRARQRACVRVEEARSDLRVELTGPTSPLQVGQVAEFSVSVTNTGDTVLTRIRILESPNAAAFEPTFADPDHVYSDLGLEWEIDSLPPGRSVVRRLDCNCIAPNPAAENRVEVTTAEGARGSDMTTTVIERAPPPVPARNPNPPGPAPLAGPGTGRLDLSIIATDPSISINGETTFIIALRNDLNTFVRNVVVSFALPDGLAFRDGRATPAELGPPRLTDGEFQFSPIAEMRPGGERIFRVTVVGRQVGRHRVEARAQAGRDAPETEAAEVFVNP